MTYACRHDNCTHCRIKELEQEIDKKDAAITSFERHIENLEDEISTLKIDLSNAAARQPQQEVS